MRLSQDAVNVATDSVLRLLDGGTLVLLDGQTRLVTLQFGTPAFGKAVAGVARAVSLAPGTAEKTGTASMFAALSRSGNTVFMGTAGLDDRADLKLPASIQAGTEVIIDRLEYRTPQQ